MAILGILLFGMFFIVLIAFFTACVASPTLLPESRTAEPQETIVARVQPSLARPQMTQTLSLPAVKSDTMTTVASVPAQK